MTMAGLRNGGSFPEWHMLMAKATRVLQALRNRTGMVSAPMLRCFDKKIKMFVCVAILILELSWVIIFGWKCVPTGHVCMVCCMYAAPSTAMWRPHGTG